MSLKKNWNFKNELIIMKGNKNNVHKKWTHDDADYIRSHLGTISWDDMANALGRSTMSIRLYVLRHKLTPNGQVKCNRLAALLQSRFKHPEDFTPSRAFYQETGIGQRRYWDIYFGRKAITGKEYAAVAEYLGVSVTEAFEALQLDLFEERK